MVAAVIGVSTLPRSVIGDCIAELVRAALISLLSPSMIRVGVFFGAPTPFHALPHSLHKFADVGISSSASDTI